MGSGRIFIYNIGPSSPGQSRKEPRPRNTNRNTTHPVQNVIMKSFFTTIAIIAAMMTHPAIASDSMLDFEWEDDSHFELEENSIAECGIPPPPTGIV